MTRARVTVAGETVGEIREGLLIYLGVAPSDSPAVAQHLAARLARLRIFPDRDGRMNRSVLETGGEALVVSQFTLFADSRRGHRPSFTAAAGPDQGRDLCQLFLEELQVLGVPQVSSGQFGAHMEVESVNQGPVTIVVSSAEDPWVTDCG